MLGLDRKGQLLSHVRAYFKEERVDIHIIPRCKIPRRKNGDLLFLVIYCTTSKQDYSVSQYDRVDNQDN